MIYLDNAATTAVSLEVFSAMVPAMVSVYGNPSSLHSAGRTASKLVEDARARIADCIGAYPDEIFFSSGGSEADNLALRGIVPTLKKIGKTTIVTSSIEHHAVLHTCRELERYGINVIYMPVDRNGVVYPDELERTIVEHRDEIGLVSIMAVNNEVGSIQNVGEIGAVCRKYGKVFMTDAVQVVGHIPIDVRESHIDLMALSGHKFQGPKGIGVLFVRRGLTLAPMIVGGGQEFGLRAGTENVPGVVGMAKAMEIATEGQNDLWRAHDSLRRTFLKELDKYHVDYIVNGACGVRSIISLTLPGCESEAILLLLNERGICVSAGSACTAGSLEPSHDLRAMGLNDRDASCTIRISMGANTTVQEITAAAYEIAESVKQLRSMML